MRDLDFQPDDLLYRAIHPSQWLSEKKRPFSSAFKDEELSVDWSKIHSPEDLLDWWIAQNSERDGSGIAEFRVQLAIDLQQLVKYNPLLDGEFPNPAHTLVVGKKTDSIARKLAKSVRMALAVKTT